MKIYFAGAIRGGRDDSGSYSEIIHELQQYGEVFTEHIGDGQLTAFGETGTDQEIHDRDLNWLKAADCLVAEVTTPSLGVGYEIARAGQWAKPILCLYRITNERRLSAMIAGSEDVKVGYYQNNLEVKALLTEFFSNQRT